MGLGKKNANVEEQIEKVDKQIEPTSEELQSPTSQDVGLLSATQVDQVTMYEGSIPQYAPEFTGRPLGSMVAHLCPVLKLF